MEVENYIKKNLLDLNKIMDKENNNLLSIAVQSGYFGICLVFIRNGLPINIKNVSATKACFQQSGIEIR